MRELELLLGASIDAGVGDRPRLLERRWVVSEVLKLLELPDLLTVLSRFLLF